MGVEYYDPMPWVGQPITLLELRVRTGGSVALWRDYFPRASIVGIDIRLPRDFVPGERVRLFRGSQADPKFLARHRRVDETELDAGGQSREVNIHGIDHDHSAWLALLKVGGKSLGRLVELKESNVVSG